MSVDDDNCRDMIEMLILSESETEDRSGSDMQGKIILCDGLPEHSSIFEAVEARTPMDPELDIRSQAGK